MRDFWDTLYARIRRSNVVGSVYLWKSTRARVVHVYES